MKINIESSTACNARCTFCSRYDMTRPMGEMSDELFYKIIKEAKELKVRSVSPFMNGEPFVFPRIWEWLDHMEKEGVLVSLYTNAEFMDVDRLIKYKNIHYVNCSLNAATKETYDRVMRGPNYDVVIKNIKELFKKAPFSVRVSFIITDENAHEVELFRSMYRRRKFCGFANWTGDKHSSLARKGERVPCNVLFTQMFVLWNGLVVPCCMDYNGKQILGDANRQTLKEIRDNAFWMRDKHRKGEFDIPVCQNCNYNVND